MKKGIESNAPSRYAYKREIWWCSLGLNIGVEIDGKNEQFERPVIVMKMYNKEMMVVLPITTKGKDDAFHRRIFIHGNISWAKLTQMRVISSKRLLRKIGILDEKDFAALKNAWKASL